jgi:hypothetical protein
MYCFDQPSASSNTPTFPTVDQLIYPSIGPSPYHSYTTDHPPLIYYEPEEINPQPINVVPRTSAEMSRSPDLSVFSPNSTLSNASSSVTSQCSMDMSVKASNLLSMSDSELAQLSIRQLNSVLQVGVSKDSVGF